MLVLATLMIEKVGIIVIVAFLLSQLKSFQQIIQNEHKNSEKIILILLFGTLGIISNYTGVEIQHGTIVNSGWLVGIDPDNAIANTRVMGVVIGGILGGPVVGLGAGLIAGIHRYSLGGFTAFACSMAVVVAGIISGYFSRRQINFGKKITPIKAAILGMTLEAVQMLIILILSKPFDEAWILVQVIGIPMILVNGLGMFLFMYIIRSIIRDEERARANQTSKAFYIADQTLPFFRQGLNTSSCKEIAEIMLRLTDADAVAITDDRQVLAHVGAASDHHIPGGHFITGLTKKVLKNGEIAVAKLKEEIYCSESNCSLEAAIVLPLKMQNKTAGTLKMYFIQPSKLDDIQQQLAEGLANLFSTQLELAEAERQTKLLKDAEIKALQSQIHPHFLFNSLNSISILCRTDAGKARKLLLELSAFLRGNMQGARQMLIPLEKELENVKSYLSLVQTRFPDKYQIDFQIEPGIEKVLLPPFTLQPLVENAINYAFTNLEGIGRISIEIFTVNNNLQIVVEDSGKGIPINKLASLGKQTIISKKGTGTAIYNISKRLIGIYNGQASLEITSEMNRGTTITISIPLDSKGVLHQHVESVYSGR
ncbi:LytS/YhcK type 5TM receptor domain-containing protein [Psychrobacillus sp. NPDC096426]|uniref:LytS/YhcK type 5TM receptor domain-containing protein n=1 Tax=Psychrobacillus sp. NPDC096426 TaxID=3364491 RepID=UPI0038262C70